MNSFHRRTRENTNPAYKQLPPTLLAGNRLELVERVSAVRVVLIETTCKLAFELWMLLAYVS